MCGEGGPEAGHAPLALDGGDEGRLLAADEGARAFLYLYEEAHVRAEDVLAQEALSQELPYGVLQPLDRLRVLGPHVDVALLRADGVGADHHAFEHGMGVALEGAPVHEGAGVALVRVADDIFMIAGACLQKRHFTPVRKPPPPLPRRPEAVMISITFSGVYSFRTFWMACIAACLDVFVYGVGVDDPAVPQDDPLLLLEEEVVLRWGSRPGRSTPRHGRPVQNVLVHDPDGLLGRHLAVHV